MAVGINDEKEWFLRSCPVILRFTMLTTEVNPIVSESISCSSRMYWFFALCQHHLDVLTHSGALRISLEFVA